MKSNAATPAKAAMNAELWREEAEPVKTVDGVAVVAGTLGSPLAYAIMGR